MEFRKLLSRTFFWFVGSLSLPVSDVKTMSKLQAVVVKILLKRVWCSFLMLGLLDGWKHKGRVRAVGPRAYEKYCTLGLYAHGGISGITRTSNDEDACRAVNHFLKSRFPGKTWTSIAILCNPKMGLHCDMMNLKGHMNHAVTLGSFSGGQVWVEDENGDAPEKVEMKTKTRALVGTWHDIHDRPITFDARRFDQVEPHEGDM